ncbi:MAG TPA: NAD(P)-binding domain-containing protein [Rhizomicrobium sp.]|jgi:thioredoxin reductase
MTNICDVAVIGAGPYGLSVGAHLASKGIDFRIFGKPLSTWSQHMPKNMTLKSDGFASNLSAPAEDSTMKAWCAKKGIEYADQALPIPLDTFLDYANTFRQRFVPNVEEVNVVSLTRDGPLFTLALESGERVRARNVVLAVGVSHFSWMPKMLAEMPREYVSHSFEHREVGEFNGRDVTVLGAGASAIDLAWLLHEEGANVKIVARADEIDYNKYPDAYEETLIGRIHRPASGIGRGWRSLFCAQAPLLFYRLPANLRQRAIDSHMHPAGGFFMREKVEGNIPALLGRSLVNAGARGGKLELTVKTKSGDEEKIVSDHLIAATGYRPDMRRVPFLSNDIVSRISPRPFVTELSDEFETEVSGLFAVGLAAMHNFGPLMRFMVGAEFAAPRVVAALERRVGRVAERRAA